MKILSSITKAASGLNLYKWGAILLFYVGSVVFAYNYGVWNTRVDNAEAAAEQAAKESDAVIQEVKDRLPAVQSKDREAVELKAQVNRIMEKLNEATSKRADLPECALSDDELRGFQELIERTQ